MLSGTSVLQCCALLVLSWASAGRSARILGIFPTPGRSHYILESTLMRALSDAGHQVTIVSPFHEDYEPASNGTYRQIVLTGVAEAQKERRKAINLFERASINPLSAIYVMNKIGLKQTESTLQHPNFQALIHSGERFDAVIVGQFMNDALKGMAHHFDGHLILFSSVGTSTWVNHLVGNPSMPSYTPEMILSYPAKMTYWQRAKNALFNVLYNVNQHLVFYPQQNALLKKYVPGAIDLSDALFNVSLVLMNTHESIAFPTSAVPCMKHIGGFHVKAPGRLPDDLQQFLDHAPEGVIYFSLGSNVNSSHLPAAMRHALLQVVAQVPQKVLLKFDEPPAEPLPPNVQVKSWFPQQDVLGKQTGSWGRLVLRIGSSPSQCEAVHHSRGLCQHHRVGALWSAHHRHPDLWRSAHERHLCGDERIWAHPPMAADRRRESPRDGAGGAGEPQVPRDGAPKVQPAQGPRGGAPRFSSLLDRVRAQTRWRPTFKGGLLGAGLVPVLPPGRVPACAWAAAGDLQADWAAAPPCQNKNFLKLAFFCFPTGATLYSGTRANLGGCLFINRTANLFIKLHTRQTTGA